MRGQGIAAESVKKHKRLSVVNEVFFCFSMYLHLIQDLS